jgi:hypothetical protein
MAAVTVKTAEAIETAALMVKTVKTVAMTVNAAATAEAT